MISGKGAQTLNLLRTTLAETQSYQMCFLEARKHVDNATQYANLAKQKADEALSVSFMVIFITVDDSSEIETTYWKTCFFLLHPVDENLNFQG